MTNILPDPPIRSRRPAGPVRRPARRGAAALLPRSGSLRSFRYFLCLLAFIPWASAPAQVAAEQPAGEGGDTPPPQAMIRAFLVPAEGAGASLQLVVKPQQADDGVAPQVVATSDGSATFSDSYQRIAPGGVVVELRAGDKVVAKDAGALRPARAYTFVAWQASSAADWQIKAFADDPATPAAADRALRLLNFPAGRKTLFSIGQGTETTVPGNAVQEVRAPAKVVVASVKVLASDGGPPAHSTLEIDYTTLGSGYMVVMPDNLGRMRPQFIGGGYQEEVELAPPPTTAAAPVTAEATREQRITGAQMELDQQETVLKMIAAREAAMGDKPSATLLENKREAEKRLAELRKNLEEARSATPSPGTAAPASVPGSQQ